MLKIKKVTGTKADKSSASTSRHQATYTFEDGKVFYRETQKWSDGDYLDAIYFNDECISDAERPSSNFSNANEDFEDVNFKKYLDIIYSVGIEESDL